MPIVSPPHSYTLVAGTGEFPCPGESRLRLRGSLRHRTPFITYLYSSPGPASPTSADHTPEVTLSKTNGFAALLQPLNVPATVTSVAPGAQTRNVVPVPASSANGTAPHPGRDDCAHASPTHPARQAMAAWMVARMFTQPTLLPPGQKCKNRGP